MKPSFHRFLFKYLVALFLAGATLNSSASVAHLATYAYPTLSQTIPAPTAMLEWLKKHENPKSNLAFEHLRSGWITGKALFWSAFGFNVPNDPDGIENGQIILVWGPYSEEPAWMLKESGDFMAHTLRWTDFNGDGEPDLLVMSGEEEYYRTALWLWRGKPMPTDAINPPPLDRNNLKSVYESNNSYATMLDVNKDGVAEILDNGRKGEEETYSLCQYDSDGFRVSKKSRTGADAQYLKLAGRFARHNLMYSIFRGDSLDALNILDPIRLLRFDRQGKSYEASLPIDHLQWRIEFLQNISKLNKGRCLKQIQKALKHNQKLLKAAK